MDDKTKMTQEEMILDYIAENGFIDRVKAASELFIFELAARIRGLEKKGYVFEKTPVTKTNRFGRTYRMKEYRLVC